MSVTAVETASRQRRSTGKTLTWLALALIVGAGLGVVGSRIFPRDVKTGPATWLLDPAGGAITSQSRVLRLLVTESASASAEPPGKRLHHPRVSKSRTQIVISVRVEALTGLQQCPGNPSTPVTVDLDEPVGHRALMDGGESPPAIRVRAP